MLSRKAQPLLLRKDLTMKKKLQDIASDGLSMKKLPAVKTVKSTRSAVLVMKHVVLTVLSLQPVIIATHLR